MDDERRFADPVTTTGGPVVRRRGVADRQKSPQKLLFEVAEDSYDGELDVDWDQEPATDKLWMPETLTSLYGSRLWNSLSAEQRRELGRRELVAMLSLAMVLETAASMLTFRTMVYEQRLVDDRTRFLLATVNERARSVTMFSRLINRIGVGPYIDRDLADRLAHRVLMTPDGPISQVLTLLADEFVDALANETTGHPADLQPHVLQVLKVHAVSRNRHVEFGWDELEESVAASSGLRRRIQSVVAAAILAFLGPALIDGQIYEDIGIGRRRGLWAAYISAQYRRRAQALTSVLVVVGRASGLFTDRGSRAILKLGRCWPAEPDIWPSRVPGRG